MRHGSGVGAVDAYVADGYDGVRGMSSRIAAIVCAHLLRRQTETGIFGPIAEFGAFQGRFLIALALALSDGEKAAAIDLFDWPGPETLDILKANLSRFGLDDRVVIVRADTATLGPETIRDAVGGPLRFIHIDGEHSREALTRDLDLALGLLHPRGIIALDDMLHPGYPLLIVALHEWLTRHEDMRVVCVIDREDIVAAPKLLLCREPAYAFYETDLMASFPGWHFVLGSEWERWFCVVLTPHPRVAEVD